MHHQEHPNPGASYLEEAAPRFDNREFGKGRVLLLRIWHAKSSPAAPHRHVEAVLIWTHCPHQ
jgi:hypothetical protein